MSFIKLTEVMKLTGLSRSSIYQFMNDETFPCKIKLGAQSVAWVEEEVLEWMSKRVADRANKNVHG